MSWYRKAAEQGLANAQYILANGYYNGEGVAKDEIEAYAYYNLAGMTHKDARKNLAILEKKISRDEIASGQQRTKQLQKEIEAKRAGKLAGLVYLPSSVSAGMTPKEVEGYKAKAETGDRVAQYNLGLCYIFGDGVAKDQVQAVAWYRKAAAQGYAEAQFNLGNCYANGEGVAKDQVQAVSWYRKAAEQGNAYAQFNLGNCYANGEGVAKDQVQAVSWYRKAAEQGLAYAQFTLGNCYANGEGVAKDQVQAMSWYRKAAEQGLAYAQFILGNCYANGEGVAKDEIEAYAYYNLAGMTYKDARKNLAILEKKISRDGIASGQQRTKQLQKEIEAKRAGK
jgi:TPR repeat protein